MVVTAIILGIVGFGAILVLGHVAGSVIRVARGDDR